MQNLASKLRVLMDANQLDQEHLAAKIGVSQATISRALKGKAHKRRGHAFVRVCNYMQQYGFNDVSDMVEKEEVHKALDRIWSASQTHADAVARLLRLLDDCIQRGEG